MIDLIKEKEAFAEYCRMVQGNGLVFGSGGNVSMRCADTVLITPSGRSLESLRAEDIVEIDMNGKVIGEGVPSSEFRMHLGCYKARPEISTVLHVHSLYTVALSCMKGVDPERSMPVYTPGYGKRVGALPMIPYMLPGSISLSEAVTRVIKERNSVLMKNHGLVTVGKSREAALNLAEEIEENAHITLLLGGRGEALNEAQIADLVNYGKGVK